MSDRGRLLLGLALLDGTLNHRRMLLLTKARANDKSECLKNNVLGHLGGANAAIHKGNGGLNNLKAMLHHPISQLNLEGVALRLNGIQIDRL